MTFTTERSTGPVYDSGAPRPNAVAAVSLTLAIVGLVVGIIPFFIGLVLGFVPTVLAIVLGLIGLARTSARRSGFVPALLGTAIGCGTVFLWTIGYGTAW